MNRLPTHACPYDVIHVAGLLHPARLRFSRDQAHKIYVHTRMGENAAKVWCWLDEARLLSVLLQPFVFGISVASKR